MNELKVANSRDIDKIINHDIFFLSGPQAAQAAGLSTTITPQPRFGSHQCFPTDGMPCLHGGLCFEVISS